MCFNALDCLILFKVIGVSSPDTINFEKHLCPSTAIRDLSFGEFGTFLRIIGLFELSMQAKDKVTLGKVYSI